MIKIICPTYKIKPLKKLLHESQYQYNFLRFSLAVRFSVCAVCTPQNGYTPLHIAAKRNRREIAVAALKHGANPNAESVVRDFWCTR